MHSSKTSLVRRASPLRGLSLLLFGLIAGLALACGGGGEEAEVTADPIEAAELGLQFTRLPEGFSVAENDSRLVLASDGESGGTMTVEAGEPSEFGLDPVVDANGQQAHYESLEGGEFLGVQKLVVPAGPAAYARGRYTEEGRTLERATVFVVHPTVNRMVSASYVYPAGETPEDSRARVQQLFELVGEMEALEAGEADPG